MQKAIEYFGSDELPASVFTDKYALRDGDEVLEGTPDDMHWRMAREFARVEKKKFSEPYSAEFIYECFKDFGLIIPQGSLMSGIGSKSFSTLSNCFVCAPPLDSFASLHHTDEQLTAISKRRGGVGTDMSHIRPSNLPTSNAARKASGVVSFCERFSNTIREVGQNGRRGALMLTLDVHHPQIIDFTKMKLDPTKVTGANVSVRLSDKFLNAVLNNDRYEQRWPIDAVNPVMSNLVEAKSVWKEIIHCAWKRAEPGLLFWDRIISESPADCYAKFGFKTVSTNPCIRKSTYVITKDGLRQIGDLDVGSVIWSKSGWTTIINKWESGKQKVFRYQTTAGFVDCTEHHHILSKKMKIPACLSESIDVLRGPDATFSSHNPQIVMDGLYFGDGSSSYKFDTILYIGKDDTDYFDSEISFLIRDKHSHSSGTSWTVDTTLNYTDLDKPENRRVPKKYMEASQEDVCSFLRGVYSANGSVCADRVTLKTACFGLVGDVQQLLSSVGIYSYFTTNKPTDVKFANGTYTCKQSYDINITTDRVKFQKLIGFIQEYKNKKLADVISRTGKADKPAKVSFEVKSKEFLCEEEVYSITVDNDASTYWQGCCDVSNCSELPLNILDSCRLLLLNLFGFVENPFTKAAKFNYKKFYQYCKIAQRLMDDVIDLEIEMVERIIKKVESDPEPEEIKCRELELWKTVLRNCVNGRRTGTGITALGDVMAAIGVPYGSDESIEITGLIYKTMKLACYESSVEMAKQVGPFPIWDHELEKDCPFLNRLNEEDVVVDGLEVYGKTIFEQMKKYGRRNIALLTTAPAGSVSIMAGPRYYWGTTSGIEPLFTDVPYTRRKKITPGMKDARVDFVDDLGDKWTNYPVFHAKIKMWMDITGETDWKKSPYHGCTANDIDWKQRVRLQAIATKYLDHSVSSTLNLPNDVTEEKVAEIYETAWKAGCKGITVYRDGCRSGVLVKEEPAAPKEQLKKTDALKRPADVACDIHKLTIKGNHLIVLVGLVNGEPYEVFAFTSPEEKLPKSGTLKKLKRGRYDLINDDGEVVVEDVSALLSENEEALTRMTSMGLRHGADTTYIVDQLSKVKGDMHSFAKALSRALKKYVKDGTKVTGTTCGTCGSDSVVYQEGCHLCKNCGASKCG